MKRIFSIALAVLFISSLSACATAITRTPVPESMVSKATVIGFPEGIRFWADEAPRDFGPFIARRIEQYRAANIEYHRNHHAYPDMSLLAISGGAYDGAFGAGLLSGWSASGHRPDFDLVTGVSTGALIAPFVFIGSQHDEEVRRLFTTTSSNDILVTGPLEILRGITGGPALTDNSPLKKKIGDSITPEIMNEIATEYRKGKSLYIGTTNMEAQRGVIWDIGAIANSGNPDSLKLIQQVMLASASIPGLFKPVLIDVEVAGSHYTEIHADGGVTSQVSIYPLKLERSIIRQFDQAHLARHLYIVRNGKLDPEFKELKPSFYALSSRSIETLTKAQGLGDLYRIYVSSQRDGIDYNLASIPASFTARPKELFDPEYMGKLFELGYSFGLKQHGWLKQPPGVEYTDAAP